MGKNTAFSWSNTHKSNGRTRPVAHVEEQLIPGFRDADTEDLIIPNLSWGAIEFMSSIWWRWKHALESHRFYNIRVRTCSTETLAVVVSNKSPAESSPKMVISLYSIRDKFWREVRSIPGLPHGLPLRSQCVSLDGKLYILGGDVTEEDLWSAEVYVLDLARGGLWKPLKSMQEGRRQFAAAVMNGKIHVFGGTNLILPSLARHAFRFTNSLVPSWDLCEAYDPKTDSWFSTSSMTSVRFGHHVSTMGEELLLHGGALINHHLWASYKVNGQLYDPTKNTWRVEQDFIKNSPSEVLFSAGGKLHAMTSKVIYVFDIGKQSWTVLQACLPPVIEGTILQVGLDAPLAVGDELLIVAHSPSNDRAESQTRILCSTGFGKKGEVVVWRTVPCPHHNSVECSCLKTCSLPCSIQL